MHASYAQQDKRQETLSFCISQINNVQERERILISQELHDEYLQTFSIIRMKVGALINKVTSMDKSILSSRISEIENELSMTLRKFRSYTQNLRPHLINEQGLMTAIDNMVNDYNTIDNLRISLTVFGNETKFTNDKELMIFHIIQESVRNIVKHAESTRAGIKIKYFKSHASFSITDNGKGFILDEIESNITNKKTLGLIGIRDRISLISGSLSIESTPGKGTIIKFKVPYH
jgi:signal transduction histidine kinase